MHKTMKEKYKKDESNNASEQNIFLENEKTTTWFEFCGLGAKKICFS